MSFCMHACLFLMLYVTVQPYVWVDFNLHHFNLFAPLIFLSLLVSSPLIVYIVLPGSASPLDQQLKAINDV